MLPENINSLRSLEVLYKENCQFHRDMVEWRHKILLRYFVTVAALLFLAKWVWEFDSQQIKTFLFLPFILVAFLSLCFYLMDRRNIQIMSVSENVGRKLEKQLNGEGGYFIGLSVAEVTKHIIAEKKLTIVSYTFVLGFLYLSTCVAALLFAIYLMINF